MSTFGKCVSHNIEAPDIDENILNHVSHFTSLMTDSVTAQISSRILRPNDSKTRYLATKRQSEQSALQQLINVLTPLLLAFALALKITKVTAEYLAFKQKE